MEEENAKKNSVTFNKMCFFSFERDWRTPNEHTKTNAKKKNCLFFLIHEKSDEHPNFKFCFKHGLLKLDAFTNKNLKESLSLYNRVRTHTVCPNYGGTRKTIDYKTLDMVLKCLYQIWTNV